MLVQLCGLAWAFVLVVRAAPLFAATNSNATLAFDVSRGPGTDSCPDHDALAAAVDRRLVNFGSTPKQVVAERVFVAIVREGDTYVATLSTVGTEAGVRRFADSSPDCEGLAEALALTLAMIADGRPLPVPQPLAVDSPPPIPPVASASAPSTPATAPSTARSLPPAAAATATVSTTVAPSTTRGIWQIGAGALASSFLGAATVGYDIDLMWTPQRHLGIAVSGLWLPARTITRSPGTTDVSMEAGLARLCWAIVPLGARLAPSACADLATGALHGHGFGYAGSTSASGLWMAAGATVNADVRFSKHWSLGAQTGTLYPFRGQRFTIGGLGAVYESDHWAWLAGVDLRLRVW